MMPVMVKEADLNRIEVPEDYEVLDATALGRRLGFKRDTVLAYLARTANLLWDLSGMSSALGSGKRRKRVGRMVGRRDISQSDSRGKG
jgi:hypothetical protein